MGRKAAIIRSRKNTNTAHKVETVKNLLVNSGIGNNHLSEWNESTNNQQQHGMSRTSSLESDEVCLNLRQHFYLILGRF